MAKPIRTASGKWRIQVFLGYDENGKRIYHKETLETRKDAIRMIALLAIKRKTAPRISQTVKSGINKFISSVDAVLSPSTIVGYRQLARNAFRSIEHIQISDLTQADVQACINKYASDHSPKTVRNAHGLLSRVLKFLGHEGFTNISLPAKSKTKIVIPTDSEVAALLELAEHPGLRQAILLAVGAGMRRSEVAALEWRHINYNHATITVEQAYVRTKDGSWHLGPPKTFTSNRTIDVGKDIMDGFKSLPVVPGGHPIGLTPDAITRRFERLCKKAGLSFRYHDLRHYHASVMLAEGVPDKYAMERIGHASTKMLRDVYQHTMSNERQEFSNRINDRIAQRLSGPGRASDDVSK